jgi:tetratricopeptide (TPR) repeat protein
MPFNHLGMAEPSGSDDDPYLWAMGKVLEAGANEVTRRKAEALLQSASASVLAGDNAAARRAYDESSSLYVKLDDRRGQASVLSGLGDLESQLGRNDEARTAYTEARSLYKAVGNRLGEANVLLGSGWLEAILNPELARQHFHQAAFIYEQMGMDKWKEIAISESKKLSH